MSISPSDTVPTWDTRGGPGGGYRFAGFMPRAHLERLHDFLRRFRPWVFWRDDPMAHADSLLGDARREVRHLTDDELILFGQNTRRYLREEQPDWVREWMQARLAASLAEWKWRHQSRKPSDNLDFRDWIDRAKQAVDLAALIALPLPSRPVGRGRWMVCCPLHSDSDPSLHVDADRRVWYCHGCGVGGDALTWLHLAENLDWKEALVRLEQLSGVERPRRQTGARTEGLGGVPIVTSWR